MQRAAAKAAGNSPKSPPSFQEQFLPEDPRRQKAGLSSPGTNNPTQLFQKLPFLPWRAQACFKTHNSTVNMVKE